MPVSFVNCRSVFSILFYAKCILGGESEIFSNLRRENFKNGQTYDHRSCFAGIACFTRVYSKILNREYIFVFMFPGFPLFDFISDVCITQ